MTISDFYYDSLTLGDFADEVRRIERWAGLNNEKARELRQLAEELGKVAWAPGYKKLARKLRADILRKAAALDD